MTNPTLERPVVSDPQLDNGDHERFAHYAEADKIGDALVYGLPIQALCGKVWVPSRDPSKFPICPECKELYEMGPAGRAEFWAKRRQERGE